MHRHENHHIVGRAIRVAIISLLSIHSVIYAQVDTSYAFIVAGHAYGSHDGVNIGLHPKLLNSLNSGYDSNAAFIVFTGDIVNHSTSESWQQVENELAYIGLPSYYVMGNHDDNDIGWQIFEDKFGSTYYMFCSQSELYIVLNSTEEDRSISSNQIGFLNEQISLAGDTTRNIFIFFHEVLWNSHEKYIGLKSNKRSRYDQMVNFSNYWEEVHPMLSGNPDKNFYLIAGDVGGNPDAIAAFYDTWDNVTFLASGMGEVTDENFLLIRVHHKDSIEIGLIPLDCDISLPDIEFYERNTGSLEIDFMETDDYLMLGINWLGGDMLSIRIFDMNGRILISGKIKDKGEYTEFKIDKNDTLKGIIFLSASTKTRRITEKYIIR